MKKIGILSVVMLCLMAMTSFSFADMHSAKKGSYSDHKAHSSQSTLYAVSFFADWCGSCKALEPKVIKARGKADLDNQNVLFVTLDLTDKTKRYQSQLMANALGISDFYKKNSGKTGFVLLVNSRTGEVVGKLTKDMDAGQIATTIEEKIRSL